MYGFVDYRKIANYYSNTTNVKVKFYHSLEVYIACPNSNTTNVKVKFNPFKIWLIIYTDSNTTNVKVKSINYS